MTAPSPLQRLIDRAHAADIAVHSLEVRVAGRTVARAGIAPFGPDVPHRLYSVSKSFTGLAVLLLAEEGRLDLDQPIAEFFPEFAPVHPWLAQTSIDHVLSMTGPHPRTVYDGEGDGWLEAYFRTPPTHRPGTLFTYDTGGSYALSALVERLAGVPMLDYLRPRVLDPLGIGADARFRCGPEGISHGGSGLIMRPGDLLPIAEAINGDGVREGVRVLPERVVTRLRERRSDPGTQTWGAPLRLGYGRQLWLPGGGRWLMFGLGGQFVLGDPARELALVLTADATALQSGDQRLLDLVLDALDVPGFDDVSDSLSLTPPTPAHDPAHAVPTVGAFRIVTGEDAPDELRLDIGADGGTLDAPGLALRFGAEHPLVFRDDLGDAVVTAGWSAPGVLDVRVSAVGDDIASQRIRIVVSGDGVVTVMAQGFGPAIPAARTWRGCYRAG